jgi:hypothetical protein
VTAGDGRRLDPALTLAPTLALPRTPTLPPAPALALPLTP